MVVEEQGLVGFAFAFAVDNRRPARGHDLSLEAAALQHLGYQRGALVQPAVLRRDAGNGAKLGQFIQAFVEVIGDVFVSQFGICHSSSMERMNASIVFARSRKAATKQSPKNLSHKAWGLLRPLARARKDGERKNLSKN